VLAIPTQNVPAGNFDAISDAIGSNTAYANAHTTNFLVGEIRGQVRSSEGNQDKWCGSGVWTRCEAIPRIAAAMGPFV
jgi:hypothetical protein